MKKCLINNCTDKYEGHGYCVFHRSRWRRYGDPLYKGRPRKSWSLEQRFLHYVRKTRKCWIWEGQKNSNGYGKCSKYKGYAAQLAHRFSFEFYIKKVPIGYEIDHFKCKNRACVNPKHLRIATHKENMENSFNALKTHCYKGHKFTKPNTYVVPQGGRSCRKCRKDYWNTNCKTPEYRIKRNAYCRKKYREKKAA